MNDDDDDNKYINKYIRNCLQKYNNRNEILSDLLHSHLKISESTNGLIFIKNINGDEFKCIRNSCIIDNIYTEIDINNINIKIEENNGYEHIIHILDYPYKIIKKIDIPMYYQNELVSIICLINSKFESINIYTDKVSHLISLSQLVLENIFINERYDNLVNNTKISKDLFLAKLSHEIRTPANGVIGYGQLLMQTELTQIQKVYLQSQNQCCIQLMQIINDILDFTKLSSEKMSMNKQCFSIEEVVDIVKNTLWQRILEKKQKIHIIIDNKIPHFIILDKQKLIQILINLVSNAHKFTDIEGSIEIYFNNKENYILEIIVKDNGIGISKKDQSKLFSVFGQVEPNLCSSGGSGLGLVISYKLAKFLGGYIKVVSDVGMGSSFIVNLKYDTYDNYEKNIKKNAKILKDKLVLIVDDNADNRILLSEMLFEWKMKPVVCASAIEAFRLIIGNRYNFSLGLIDICMPGISGTELAKQIKEELPLLPLIAISSIDSFITTKEFEYRLNKPVNKIELFNYIHSLIHKYNNVNINNYIVKNKRNENILFEKTKILVVDDVLYSRNMLKNMLNVLKYENVDVAENGNMAITLLNQKNNLNDNYDIILLDLHMPVLNGYDVIKHIKKNNWKLPKIIVVTASVIIDDRNKCQNLGIKYFLTKPIDMKELNNLILYILTNEL